MSEEFTVREMLEMIMGADGKRKLRLRHKTNDELFQLYDAQLVLRYQTKDTLEEARRNLRHFREFIGEFPPTPELAASFLAQFRGRKATTLHRYHAVMQGFMVWYGEKLDFKIKVPDTLPDYVEDTDMGKVKAAMASKKTHKKVIERNLLLIELGCKTGMRRGELAALQVGDINLDRGYLVVKLGKGQKDRIIDLAPSLAERLRTYLKGKDPAESVFGLASESISGIIHWASEKAGVSIHTHSLRHFFGERLVDNGTDIEVVRRLMGHSSLNNTKKYLARTDKQRRDAIISLDSKLVARGGPASPLVDVGETSLVGGAAVSDIATEPLRMSAPSERFRTLSFKTDRVATETAHTANVRRLAATLAERIALPSFTDKNLWRDLPLTKPGIYHLELGTATVPADGTPFVVYNTPHAGAVPHLEQSLEAHLESCGLPKFSGLTGKTGLVSGWCSEVGHYSEAALSLLSLAVSKIRRKFPEALLGDTPPWGPTKWFAVTVWHDVIENASGHQWLNDSWYKSPEKVGDKWVLRCGAFDIARGDNVGMLNGILDFHVGLRSDTELAKDAQALAVRREQLDHEAARLRELLQKFSDLEVVPGCCELCEPGLG